MSNPFEKGACFICPPPQPEILPMDAIIAVGFGYAAIHKDGRPIYVESRYFERYLYEFEAMAKADPNHEWTCILHGPLTGATFQRNDKGEWVQIEKNEGFA